MYWDASAYVGEILYFKIVDASSSPFDHINIDGFEFTNSIYPTNDFINGNFEFGLLDGWNILEGNYHFYGTYARSGHDDHTITSGIMTSGIFTVGGDGLIELKVSGSDAPFNCYITLFDVHGNEIIGARRTGHGSSIYRYEIIDVSAFIDETLFFMVIDKKSSGCFINLDAIVLS